MRGLLFLSVRNSARSQMAEGLARTTWMGTPLHELWLEDPDGNLIELYARLTEEELAQRPADARPVWLA